MATSGYRHGDIGTAPGGSGVSGCPGGPSTTVADTLVPASPATTWAAVVRIVEQTWGNRTIVAQEPNLLVHDVSDTGSTAGVPAWLTWQIDEALAGWCRVRIVLAEGADDAPPPELDAVLAMVIRAVTGVSAFDA